MYKTHPRFECKNKCKNVRLIHAKLRYPTVVPDPATTVPSIRLSGSQVEANEARRHQLKNHLRRHGLSHHWSRRQQLEVLAVRRYVGSAAMSQSRGDREATASSCNRKRKRQHDDDDDDDENLTRPHKIPRN